MNFAFIYAVNGSEWFSIPPLWRFSNSCRVIIIIINIKSHFSLLFAGTNVLPVP